MNVKTIIKPFPQETWSKPDTNEYLDISEFYFDTIQGEGIYTGVPAAFLRLQNCHLGCSFCDTKEVWRTGNPYTFDELFSLMNVSGIIEKLKAGQHLVITGGSPLLQQDRLLNFFMTFVSNYKFQPFIEIENEATIMPHYILGKYIDCWNNSPKFTNSGVKFSVRYQPDVVKRLSEFENSWFKFVISKEEDWEEIEYGFLMPQIIKKRQIILMPEGQTREEIAMKREMVVDLAIQNHVRYCTREHIIIWDKKIGV